MNSLAHSPSAHTQPGSADSFGLYVASRASAPERPAMWRKYRELGLPIISTWIDEAGEGETACNRELWQRIEREVTGASALIFYAEPGDFPLKGALVEVGMALAAGIPVRVVIPGVDLQPRSLRPLGSWAMHPLVSFYDSVADAALATTEGKSPSVGMSEANAPSQPGETSRG